MRDFKRCLLAVLFFGALIFGMTGCYSIKDLTAGDESKEEMLNTRVESFHRSVYWGKVDDAKLFVKKEKQKEVLDRAKFNRRDEKLVDLEVENITLNEDGTADVDVKVRYFRTASYVVETRRERERWNFMRLGGGWFLENIEVVESGSVETAAPRPAGKS